MKRIDKNVNSVFYKIVAKPMRTKKDFIRLLLETIKVFYVQEIAGTDGGKISIIVVDKMSRVFYQLENKIFSIVFPFAIESADGQYRIYDVNRDVDIDSKMISIMLQLLMHINIKEMSAEKILDTYCDEIEMGVEPQDIDAAYEILFDLLTIELGYIRYDYDEKHKDIIYHPINHYDINYSEDATYKIGLKQRIKIEDMISFLDIRSICQYLE